MTWSFAQSRQAAAQVRSAQLGSRAIATIRPRSVLGVVRSRAPLAMLLFVAAQDGLVAEHDRGFAVLRRPAASTPVRSGGHWLRLLRWLDRRWDLAVFAAPPSACLLVAASTTQFAVTRAVAMLAALAALVWVAVFLSTMLVFQLRWVWWMGGPSAPARERAAEYLPGQHWSVPLVHQPDPAGVDHLLQILTERLVRLIRADLQASAGDKVRLGRLDVTETLVVLASGISTDRARIAMTESQRVIRDYPTTGDVIVLASPGRLERVSISGPRRGGSFLLLYATALAVVVAVTASLVANMEAGACLSAGCSRHPATYASALRWLLQRMLFTDSSGLAPGTMRAALLGWLVSAASGMLIVVVLVAARQEIASSMRSRADHDEAISGVVASARVLILVVTQEERDAVLRAVAARVGRDAVVSHLGERAVYDLGSVLGNDLVLAQAGEQGTASATAMLMTAIDAIEQCRPDYVVATGICFGLRPDEGQHAGDIIVARRVHNLDHVKETDDPDHPTIYRGVNVGCSSFLLDRFQAGQATWSGARVHVGTVLTSSRLVNSEQFVRRLRQDFPDAIAGEMEGVAVHEAATRGVKPDWILVKAISDWGFDKTSGRQALAAANAAEFVTHVIASGALRRPRT
jgi:nucleoside phosphorylase